MRKFVVHTRAVPGCCKGASDAPTILEVEGELVTSLEDPSVTWMPTGEFMFRITKPEFLYESKETKLEDGSKKKIMVPTVYHSHAVYHELAEAQASVKRMIKSGLDFEIRKGRLASYTEEELAAKCAEVQILELK
jgi:hypothetical protein